MTCAVLFHPVLKVTDLIVFVGVSVIVIRSAAWLHFGLILVLLYLFHVSVSRRSDRVWLGYWCGDEAGPRRQHSPSECSTLGPAVAYIFPLICWFFCLSLSGYDSPCQEVRRTPLKGEPHVTDGHSGRWITCVQVINISTWPLHWKDFKKKPSKQRKTP